MEQVGIWGLGMTGRALTQYIATYEPNIQLHLYDDHETDISPLPITSSAVYYHPSEKSDFFSRITRLIPSPGIAPHKLPTHIPILREIDFWATRWRRPYIGITGSIGKTTITKALAIMLRTIGKHVAEGGNVGIPLCSLLPMQDSYDVGVCELSSAQLHATHSVAPDLAIITNIMPNHLDWHTSWEEYTIAKSSIFRHQSEQQWAILPYEYAFLMKDIDRIHRGKRVWVADSPAVALPHTQDVLVWHDSTYIYWKNPGMEATPLIPLPKDPMTYAPNLAILATAWKCLNLPGPAPIDQLSAHNRPPHRLTNLGKHNGLTFYNDSKATILPATMMAIHQCSQEGPVILFAGGTSKGVDRTAQMMLIAPKIRLCITFGAESSALADAILRGGGVAYAYATLEEAFTTYINRYAQSEDVVLFSPGGASYDLFKHYEERGDCFTQLVRAYAAQSTIPIPSQAQSPAKTP